MSIELVFHNISNVDKLPAISSKPHLELSLGINTVEHTLAAAIVNVSQKTWRNTNCRMPKAFSKLSQFQYITFEAARISLKWTIKILLTMITQRYRPVLLFLKRRDNDLDEWGGHNVHLQESFGPTFSCTNCSVIYFIRLLETVRSPHTTWSIFNHTKFPHWQNWVVSSLLGDLT